MVLYVIPHVVLRAAAHVVHCALLLPTVLESRPVPVTEIKVKSWDIPSCPGIRDQSQIPVWKSNPGRLLTLIHFWKSTIYVHLCIFFCYKSRVEAEFDSLGHKRQNMWLQKADERTLRMTGLQHDAANIYIGGMHLPDGEG